MKRSLIYLILLLWAGTAYGQHILTYQSYAKGVAEQDTTTIQVIENAKCLKIRTEEKKLSNPVPGYARSSYGQEVAGPARERARCPGYH